jgi:hypothetical protein
MAGRVPRHRDGRATVLTANLGPTRVFHILEDLADVDVEPCHAGFNTVSPAANQTRPAQFDPGQTHTKSSGPTVTRLKLAPRTVTRHLSGIVRVTAPHPIIGAALLLNRVPCNRAMAPSRRAYHVEAAQYPLCKFRTLGVNSGSASRTGRPAKRR